MTSPIEVLVGEVVAGEAVIERRPGFTGESMTFTYRDSWITDGFALSIDLPLQRGPQTPAPERSIFVAFDDAAPDAWGRTLLRAAITSEARAAGRRINTISDLQLLLRVSDDTRQGALRFRQDGELLGNGGERATIADLIRLEAAAQRWEQGAPVDDPDIALLLGVGSSPGGARPKAWVRDEDGTLLLAKFPRTEDPFDVSAWEDAIATMLRAAGIRTMPSRTIRLGHERSIFLTPRFDRDGAQRIPFMSFRSLFGLAEGERPDYATLASRLRRVSAAPERDVRELFDRAAFSALVRNDDDHMRNHGVLRQGAGWRLAPAFDVNPTHRAGEGTPLIPGGTRIERDARELRDAATAFGLSTADADARIREIAAVVREWRGFALEAGVAEDALDHMAGAFAGAELVEAERTGPIDDGPADRPAPPSADAIWVDGHTRRGRRIPGHWRRR